ncbi:Uncharacterized protein TPAR_02290 [Tolypocladium paradoxum]|uniref:Signal recognition particle receptor subunit beta n=1 Tax=Tolypocladium paradoxum TaxID=94208 RepID=A0A2S4L502_9HYPO|nr:Uncharacterized protein TPAR_02290 [Tolypocladium paradoxum]
MATFADVVEALMTPSLPVILIGLLVVLGAPVLLHLILASSATYTTPPVAMLLGPDNAGKTALLTLLERGTAPAQTHTSQAAHAVELSASTDSASRTSFRNHDDASGTHTKFLLVDTPGHAKLRTVAMGRLARADKLRAVVFVVDAAALGERDALAPAAAYLYDVLLHLQKLATGSGERKAARAKAVPVLVAANKMDLFTALPAAMVRAHLETELTRIRASRSKGLLDSGVGVDDVGSEEQHGWLGEYGSEKFTFEQMREFDIDVDVVGGSVMAEHADVDKWWWWIAQRV